MRVSVGLRNSVGSCPLGQVANVEGETEIRMKKHRDAPCLLLRAVHSEDRRFHVPNSRDTTSWTPQYWLRMWGGMKRSKKYGKAASHLWGCHSALSHWPPPVY